MFSNKFNNFADLLHALGDEILSRLRDCHGQGRMGKLGA
jgi:hypothetical protein